MTVFNITKKAEKLKNVNLLTLDIIGNIDIHDIGFKISILMTYVWRDNMCGWSNLTHGWTIVANLRVDPKPHICLGMQSGWIGFILPVHQGMSPRFKIEWSTKMQSLICCSWLTNNQKQIKFTWKLTHRILALPYLYLLHHLHHHLRD